VLLAQFSQADLKVRLCDRVENAPRAILPGGPESTTALRVLLARFSQADLKVRLYDRVESAPRAIPSIVDGITKLSADIAAGSGA